MEFWVHAGIDHHRQADVPREFNAQSNRKSDYVDGSAQHSRPGIPTDSIWKVDAGYSHKDKAEEQKGVV
jgi:hypothetical protein